MPLEQDCLARLKLRQPPFDDLLSEAFLYTDPLLDSLVETATRALEAPGAIVILAGSDGSGRSTQLQRLLDPLSEQFELIAFRGRAHLPFEAIDATIRSHLKRAGAAAGARSLSGALLEHEQSGASSILAIDDAHLLGSENIEQLLRVRSEVLEAGAQGLRLILVGSVALARGRLPLLDPADESQVVRLHLRPFNIEQSGAYLRHRLRAAGVDHPETFLTGSDVASLQTSSQGLPGVLNQHANAWLNRRCRGTRDTKQAQTVGERFTDFVRSNRSSQRDAAAKSISVAPDDSERHQPQEEFDSKSDDVAPDILSLHSAPDPQLSDYLVTEIEQSAHSNTDFERVLRHVRNHQLAEEAAEVASPEQETALDEAADAQPRPSPYWNRRWFVPALVVTALTAALFPVAWQLFERSPTLEEKQDLQEGQAESAVQDESSRLKKTDEDLGGPADEKAVTTDSSETTGLTVEQDITQKPVIDAALANDQVEAYTATTGNDASDARTLLESGENWLLRQNPQRYTVQLVAARDFDTARDFVQRNALEGVHYIRTRSLVIAVIGSYPNRLEASRLLPRLSQTVRDNGPWIRTIEAVRQSRP